MKRLLISISNANKSNTSIQLATSNLLGFMNKNGITVRSIKNGLIKFDVTTIMKDDIEKLVNEYEYEYTKIPGIQYPTKELSLNGKDEEYYLTSVFDEEKVTAIFNMSQGYVEIVKE